MSTPFIATAASIALLGAGFAATEGTRAAFVIPDAKIVDASEIADGAPNCGAKAMPGDASALKTPGSTPGQTASMADTKAPDGSCNNSQSQTQEEASQNAAGNAAAAQAPTAFAPGIPLAPFLAVPASAAGLAVATAKSAG